MRSTNPARMKAAASWPPPSTIMEVTPAPSAEFIISTSDTLDEPSPAGSIQN